MAATSGGALDVLDQNKKKNCEICANTLSRTGIKCVSCDVTLHIKCFQAVARVFSNIERQDWKCKNCVSVTVDELQNVSGSDNRIILENENLRKENTLLNHLNSELKLNNNLLNERLEDFSTTKTYAAKTAINNSVKSVVINTTVDARQSAVLLIKSKDKSMLNKDVKGDNKNLSNLLKIYALIIQD